MFAHGFKSHVIQLKRKIQITSASKLIGLESCKQIGEKKLFPRYAKIVNAWQGLAILLCSLFCTKNNTSFDEHKLFL